MKIRVRALVKTLGLISCTKRKRTKRCIAVEMYSPSSLFSKSYAYATKTYDIVLILSAKYGLISPTDVIDPYDATLNKMKIGDKVLWGYQVYHNLSERFSSQDVDIYFHAGANYRRYLVDLLYQNGYKYHVPLEGLGIGKQMKWYNEH